tara:strand:- start:186 stop:527 length:342 start_codon:yes stop_codon:yes gene_type:complete
MVYDENRKLCENSDIDSKCKIMHDCTDCGHKMSYKRNQKKCGKQACESNSFSTPYSKNGFSDCFQPHNNSFDHNKKLVERFTDLVGEDDKLVNKRMRNWIAGYITRYKQRRVD